MPRNNVYLSREKAARMEQVRTSIARWLKEEYDISEPLPERLSELLKKIEQATCERK